MSRRTLYLLAPSMMLMLAFSMIHVAESVGVLSAHPRTGWIAAVAVDAGVAMLMWLVVEGDVRLARRWAVGGVALMAYMSAFANADAVLAVIAARPDASAVLVNLHRSAFWQIAQWLTFSLPIPAVVIVLAAVLHLDHAGEPETVAAPKRERRARVAKAEHGREQVLAGIAASFEDLRAGRTFPIETLWDEIDVGRAPTADADRLALVLAHVAAHPLATDTDITAATGVARSTVGRWRRAGMLAPAAEHAARNGAHAGEVGR